MNEMGRREWTSLLFLSVLWGGSFFFIELALRGFTPFTLVWLRVAIAAGVLFFMLRAMGLRIGGGTRLWAAFAAMALLNNVLPFSLITWGQTQIAGGWASILNATTPFWTILVAHAFTSDEKLTMGKFAGVLLGLGGVMAMLGSEAIGGLGDNFLAQFACLAGAVSYALAGVFGRRFRAEGVTPFAVATGQLAASAVLLLPVMLLVETPWRLPLPPVESQLAILALAIFSTALAYLLYFRILAAAGATNLLLVTLLIPVTAISLGTLVLGERLGGAQVAGMILIGVGLAAVDGRPVRALRRSLAAPAGAPCLRRPR